MSNLWDMREDELPRQYKAFMEFLELDYSRKLKNIKEYSPDHVKRLSSKFNWFDRAYAYDIHNAMVRLRDFEVKKKDLYI
jgi:hypothetical protein